MFKLPVALVCLIVAGGLVSAAQPKDLLVPLKFVPQEAVGATSIALPGSVIDKPADLRIQDSRSDSDPLRLGQGTDDDDRLFTIRAANDVVPFVTESLKKIATSVGVKLSSTPERVLQIRLTRFTVNESNKAIGSTYSAEVVLAYALMNSSGKVVREGAASGTANRYGRARSAANCAEVLSDAMKEAFGGILNDKDLHESWATGAATAPSTGSTESVEERLKRLDDLLKKGLITKQEYDTLRAEILKSLTKPGPPAHDRSL